MGNLAKILFVAGAGILVLATASPGSEFCGLGMPGKPALNGLNSATLVLDLDSFPEEFREAVDDALLDAILDWNSACESPPAANDHPILKKETAPYFPPEGVEGQKTVPVKFGRGLGPGKPCQMFSLEMCYPLATTEVWSTGEVVVTLWEKFGKTDDIHSLDYANQPHLDWLLKHELGHVLGLNDETNCVGSVMLGSFIDVLEDGDGLIYPDHCSKLKEMHEPPEPIEDLKKYDPDNICDNVLIYCDDQGGFFSPWPKIRSRCMWIPDVATVVVQTSLGETHTSKVTYLRFECFQWPGFNLNGLPWGETENFRAPTIVLAKPVSGATAVGSVLPVLGWSWGNTDAMRQLAFWIDGLPAPGNHISTNLYSPEACQAGIDPGTCNPNGGFQGYIDVSSLTPGRHYLQIIATDMYPDPMPNYLEVEFFVPSSVPNQAPSAVNDIAQASIGMGTTRPIQIPVTSNDSDPEGWPIQLVSSPIVTPPNKGYVRRLGDGMLEYTPLPNSSGTDSFQYKIEDNFGVTATATVTIQIMEGIFLP